MMSVQNIVPDHPEYDPELSDEYLEASREISIRVKVADNINLVLAALRIYR